LSLVAYIRYALHQEYVLLRLNRSFTVPISVYTCCLGETQNLDFTDYIHLFINISFVFVPSISVFFLTSDVHQPLSQIRISLASSLGAGQVIFLAGINATANTVRKFYRFVEFHLL